MELGAPMWVYGTGDIGCMVMIWNCVLQCVCAMGYGRDMELGGCRVYGHDMELCAPVCMCVIWN